MSIEEAAELARRSIYHATFRDGASGGVVSGLFLISHIIIKHDDLACSHCFYLLFVIVLLTALETL